MTPLAYDTKGAAAATGLSKQHILDALNSGVLKGKRSSVKNGEPVGKWLIPAAELQSYVDALPAG